MSNLKVEKDFIPQEMWEKIDDKEKSKETISRPSMTYFQDAWRRLKKNPMAMIGLVVIILLFLTAVFGPYLSKYSFSDQNLDYTSLSSRLGLYKIDDDTYVHVANGLRMYTVTKDGKLLDYINELEMDVIQKNKTFEVDGNEIILDFKSKPFKLLNEKGEEYPYFKKVFNKNHWFGTDDLGRDLLIRVIYGARISLLIALVASLVNLIIGVLYGGISGFAGGRVDNIMMRIVDIINTVPLMLYVIMLMVVFKPGLQTIIIALGSVYWVRMARIVRGQILSLKEQEFVMAAKTLGASNLRILVRHLLPNAMGPIIVSLTMMIPSAIFTEAFLSFIGLGVPAPEASWGTLCNDALVGLRSYPYQLFFPAATISITILAFNFLGDGLRDALDPRLRK